jgi:DNA polymerase type B, organellar and viral
MNKQIPFEDIDDYLVDADVNSLYPAAMQNEFPVGIPNTLKPNSPSVAYFNELIQKTAKCPKIKSTT